MRTRKTKGEAEKETYVNQYVMSKRPLSTHMTLENISLINSAEFRSPDVDSNIICIGGPNANDALKTIFEQEIHIVEMIFPIF